MSEPIPKPTILFVCVQNAGRSRMAEAFFNRMAAGRYIGLSAGTRPAPAPHPGVVQAMNEAGIALDAGPGRILTGQMAASASRVIGMGCNVKEACPALTAPLEDWQLDDPAGRPPREVAAIRDEIQRRVKQLIAELDEAVVRAAGGVVVRGGPTGSEFLLVHRPGYGDWTFPKGRLEQGESDEQCALREVEEETGIRCKLQKELSAVSYIDRHGRPKRVRYWAMQPVHGEFRPNDEVDAARWLDRQRAAQLLTYEQDRAVLDEAGRPTSGE